MRTLIIDDERLARKELGVLLTGFPQVEIIGEYQNADEAIIAIERDMPDLIFLDIQMPGKNGFEILAALEYVPRVIFVTAYDEYALKAFEVNALDYLLKPVEMHRLEAAINRIDQELIQDKVSITKSETNGERVLGFKDQIFLKDGEKCWFVTLEEVRLFESEGNYVRVYFNNHKPLILKSLNNLELRLNPKEFFRVSRKHIVNLKWVGKIETWFNGGLQVTLTNGDQVEVSRRQAAKFKEMMSL
jgi:two-component system LytT family response regulator